MNRFQSLLVVALLWAGSVGVVASTEPQAERRNPVIFVNAVTATILEGRLDGVPSDVPLPRLCPRKFPLWMRFWVSLSKLIPGITLDCLTAYISPRWENHTWAPMPGVSIRVPGEFYGDTYPVWNLDPDLIVDKKLLEYFAPMAEEFEKFGYTRNVDILAAPYDWRLLPQESWFEQATALIEKAVGNAGGEKAVLVSHSLGSPRTYAMLMSKPPSWWDKYIHSWHSIGGAWIGAPHAVEALFIGYTAGLPIPPELLAPLSRAMPSVWGLLPIPDAWGDYVQIETSTHNYTAKELGDAVMKYGNLEYGREAVDLALGTVSRLVNNYTVKPSFPVHCHVGYANPSTPIRIKIDDTRPAPDGHWGYATVVMGDGDGTLSPESAAFACEKWGSPVHLYSEAGHLSIMKDQRVFDKIMEELPKDS